MTDRADPAATERLWAPWRLGYIKGAEQPEPPPEPRAWRPGAERGCFLCRAAGEPAEAEADRRSLVLERDGHVVTLLNRYPYSNCHLLVSPLRHVAELADLSDEEHLAAMRGLSRLTSALREQIGARGFNVGLNLGSIAGAGVPGHLHWHCVPRWPGDHNFMPTLAGVRVIPQSLEAAWELLRNAIAEH
ncbi:HIT domain-containing protein [Botrimarina sp.]|uniref:HIT family protein n=1 Tax=Botrimarina sp. TaxID=2795802 RepID=UPI0032EAA259